MMLELAISLLTGALVTGMFWSEGMDRARREAIAESDRKAREMRRIDAVVARNVELIRGVVAFGSCPFYGAHAGLAPEGSPARRDGIGCAFTDDARCHLRDAYPRVAAKEHCAVYLRVVGALIPADRRERPPYFVKHG